MINVRIFDLISVQKFLNKGLSISISSRVIEYWKKLLIEELEQRGEGGEGTNSAIDESGGRGGRHRRGRWRARVEREEGSEVAAD